MNRRAFLSLSAITPLASWLPAFGHEPRVRELTADLAVIGGGVGGVACALAAAQAGLKVVMSEEFDWIGGQLTSQGVPPDEYPTVETFPCTKTYGQFRTNVRDFYRRNFPLTDAAKKLPLLNPGNGSVSKLCHEPRVAVAVLLEMLAPYLSNGRVRLLQPAVATHVDLDRDKVEAVHLAHRDTATRFVVTAPFFVDATELGDLLPLSKTEYVTGAERRKDNGEPHAPEVEEPRNHQAFTYCFAMDHVEGEDHTIDEPAGYEDWRDYVPEMTPKWPGKLLSWEVTQYNDTSKVRAVDFNPVGKAREGRLNLWTYRRIADRGNFVPDSYRGDVSLVNWPQNDYWLGNLFGGRTPAENAKHRAAAVQLSLSLLYWMQTEAPRADGKLGWKGLRLRTDVMGTETGVAQAPYVRESRRIVAEFTVTENHVGTDARAKRLGKKPGEFTAEVFKDSVGVGSYRIDLHPSSGGDNYIDVSSLPFQIPLGALLPVRVENLLPACKNIGTTHITNGCYRLHPVEWGIGEAVGNLVAFCAAKKSMPRQVRKDATLLADYQALLTKNGVQLEWPADVAVKPR
jgi:hypothetical protein